MERKEDAQLIYDILSGNDDAFNTLVQKYQRSVHALAWRKIGDFHYAEEVTQDTFLQAYQKLSTLKNPHQFAGWLYVIANRHCINWLQRSKSVTQSLKDTPIKELDRLTYERYVSEERESEATERRYEIVEKLLERLPESERTVMVLYYLGEMTAKEIGNFLGVSVNTIKSRLRRARERLQSDQELLIQEVFSGVHISTGLSQNIMRQVADLTPTPPSATKPLVPWMAFGAATVLVLLLLGASDRYLTRFQKPYSFDAASEPTIEIVDAPIVLDIDVKPDVRNQVGRTVSFNKNGNASLQTSEKISTSNAQAGSSKFSIAQWAQTDGPPAGYIRNIFATPEGIVYAVASSGLYKLAEDTTGWTHINGSIPIDESLMPMASHEGDLYIVSTDEIFTSVDRGETWRTLGPRPKGEAVGILIMDEVQPRITMYLALKDEGVFRSTDGGAQWLPLRDGFTSEKISAIAAVEKTVFAGTESGLYRLDSSVWNKLPVDTSRAVCSLAVSGNDLYVGTGSDLLVKLTPREIYRKRQNRWNNRSHPVKIFHSADLGTSWTEIMDGSEHSYEGLPSGITVLAVGETLLALGEYQSRSVDGGKTWTKLGWDASWLMHSSLPAVMANERTFYKTHVWGIHRTTDGGESWHVFLNGMTGTFIIDLVAFNDRLYAHTGYEVYQSSDTGVSWKKVPVEGQKTALNPRIKIASESKFVVIDNILYFLSSEAEDFQIFRLSTDGDTLTPIQGVPIFDRRSISYAISRLQTETATASRDAFYVEYRRGLFKWKLGDPAWTNTGLVDTYPVFDSKHRSGFKIAVSDETVYVGQRDGHLFQSFDEGDSWKDITSSLPLRFTRFKEVTFIGSTIYVATNKGTLISQTGEHWSVLTDGAGARPIVDRFATDGTTVYGVG
ncbi:MAG: sigma-70 family RNA polymerase sigma factor, partial [Candidatus Poribacteria bacterium]|nr:sigma-70 family RNA polymerase sigma factor [Candidatus Poribacteria bacterium]